VTTTEEDAMTRAGKGVGRDWKGGIDSTAESLRACLGQVERTRMALNEARRTRDANGLGTIERQTATYQVHKLHAEVIGWTQAAKEWQEEFEDMQAVAAEAAAKAQQQLALKEEQRRRTILALTRGQPPAEVVDRPGADDDGDAFEPEPEERESAWADIGGAVAR
jgi:hypothetical protein